MTSLVIIFEKSDMFKSLILSFLWFLPILNYAQVVNNRGAILTADSSTNTSVTYAVVIGVSEYKEVTPLNFAHKDAEVFANYMLSKDGMGLDSSHVKLFVNEKATLQNVGNAISDIILNDLKKGDRVIFFFAGHGDYDANILKDQALLLLYAAPKQNYFQNIFSGDFISTSDLNSRFVDPLAAKGCEVILIIDACHANGLDKPLSGGTEGGRITTLALQNMTAPVKIYSCKSDQFSLESEQWGGGRGLFSYVLMEGFYGMADADNNNEINLKEIQRYLEDNIPKLAAPNQQYPIVKIEDPEKKIATVNQDLLAAYKTERNKNLVFLAKADVKGTTTSLLQQLDSTQKKLYRICDSLIEKKETLLAHRNYLLYTKKDSTSEIALGLRRNLSAAMQEKAAAILLPMLRENNQSLRNFKSVDSADLKKAVNELEIAAGLLGEKHFLYRNLVARILFLKSLTLDNDDGISCLELSASLEPNAPYTNYYLAKRYQFKGYLEKAKLNFRKYIELMPKNAYACLETATIFWQLQEFDDAIKYSQAAIALKPDFKNAYWGLGVVYYYLKEYDKSLQCSKKILEIDPNASFVYYNLASLYSAKQNKTEALFNFELAIKKKALALNTIADDSDFDFIRSSKEFKIILQKYFTEEELVKYPEIYKSATGTQKNYTTWPQLGTESSFFHKKNNADSATGFLLQTVVYESVDGTEKGILVNTNGNIEGKRWKDWNSRFTGRETNYTETGRDEWNVFLRSEENGQKLLVDLKNKKIVINYSEPRRKEIYSITNKEGKSTPVAVLFDGSDFNGESFEVVDDIYWVGEHWNDHISSIHVNKGYKLQVFYDFHFEEKSIIIEGAWIAPPEWNNQISSIKILKN